MVALAAIGAALSVATCTPAKADGILNVTEATYVAEWGDVIVCAPLAAAPTTRTAYILVDAVAADGFSTDSAVDIVNASVQYHCPQFWPVLQRAGSQAREARVIA